MARNVSGSGRHFQVGGSGENNLPRAPFLSIEEDELKQLLLRAKSKVRHFEDTMERDIWTEALLQFSVLYIPWKTKSVGICCEKCGCKCISKSSTPKESRPSIAKLRKGPVRKTFVSSGLLTKAIVKDSPTLYMAPPRFFVPRLENLASIEDAIESWRFGTLRTQKFIPLRSIQTSEQREQLWETYTNSWWSLSRNKCAFCRIKRMASDFIRYSGGRYNLNYCGNDTDWEKAVLAYHSGSSKSREDKQIEVEKNERNHNSLLTAKEQGY